MIALAIIKNGSLYVYNEKNHQLFTRPASGLTLLGFTASNVSVASKTTAYIYDEKGRQISSRPL
jgi:hypothetical protein